MPGYQHPCRYCDKLIPPDANACPICGKVNPLGPLRCPRCAAPTRKGWVRCSSCGLDLQLKCPACGQNTFFGDYCEHCGHRLAVICPHRKCRTEQPPLGDKCIKCGKPLK
ncbi:MAG TPA: hypothetical protein GX693_04085 [Firmicutes bacterium]|nr:hypothetical protein [Bacillota bacterium]